MIGKKIYLGDSIYALYDGNAIILTTENGLADDPSNRIVMKGEFIHALNNFRGAIVNWIDSLEKEILKNDVSKTKLGRRRPELF